MNDMINRISLLLILGILFSQCAPKIHVASAEVKGYEISDEVADTDAAMTSVIAPYKAQLDEKMNEVIGQVAKTMEKGKPESTLGNWVSDAIFEMANQRLSNRKVDFAVQNYGGIRIGAVSKGPLTVGKIYELMPFDNLVAIVEMPGYLVDSLVQRFAQNGGWPVSKELTFIIEGNIAHSIAINGQSLSNDQTYLVAMPDYIANGGDQINYLKDLKRKDLDYLIRDALIDFARQTTANGSDISGNEDGRIKFSNN